VFANAGDTRIGATMQQGSRKAGSSTSACRTSTTARRRSQRAAARFTRARTRYPAQQPGSAGWGLDRHREPSAPRGSRPVRRAERRAHVPGALARHGSHREV